MPAFRFFLLGIASLASTVFAPEGWQQAAFGILAAACGACVVAALIDANVKDDEVSHSEIGGGT